jgi:PAS domain S-box-containing protein
VEQQEFSQKLQALRQRVAVLRGHDGPTAAEGPVEHILWEELQTSLEELRVAEEELRQQGDELLASRQTVEAQRQRYQDLFEFAPDAYLVTDLGGTIWEANRAAAETLGTSQKFLQRKPLVVFVAEEQRIAFRRKLDQLGRAEQPEEWELRLHKRNGDWLEVAARAAPIRPGEGRPHGLRWLLRDISARKWAEEQVRSVNKRLEERVRERTQQLEENNRQLDALLAREREARAQAEAAEKRFHDLVQGLDAIVWEAELATGRFTFVSRRAEQLLGYPVERWLAEPDFWVNLIHPDDREQTIACYHSAADEERSHDFEYRAVAVDGRVVWLREAVYVVKDASGWVCQLRGLMLDVTARKQLEEALHARIERLTFLAHAANHLLFNDQPREFIKHLYGLLAAHLGLDVYCYHIIEEEGRTLRLDSQSGLSEACAKDFERLAFGEGVSGRAASERRRVQVEDIQHTADPALRRQHVAGMMAYAAFPLVARDRLLGTLAFGTRRRSHFEPDELELMQTVCDQIAMAMERLRLIAESQLRAADLAEADRRKDEFLAMLAHELRNPLAPIRNALAILEEGADAATIAQARQVAERQVRHMAHLVDDLLDVSRITRGKINLQKEPVDLATAVGRAVESARPLISARGHTIHVTLPPEPVSLLADPTRLEQILDNLLSNAAKYTEPGGRIGVSAERQGDEAVLRVRDTGVGIAPEMLPRVFDLFAQAERSLDRAEGGLGIGLTLVRSLVELHGGSVQANSDGLGHGSEFVVRLPAAGAAARRADQPSATAPGSGGPSAARRILVVDDNVDAAQSLATLLKLWGHEVAVAHDGAGALEAARTQPPDVILLDIGLPGMSGLEVARQIRQEPRRPLLVALTGYGQEQDRRRSVEAGFEAHLVKPVDLRELRRLIAAAPAGRDR